MLIATWNVNSVRTRLSQIINWIKEVNPDILCLQETKVIDDAFPSSHFEELGYEVIIHGQKSYNGVAIISKFKIENVKKGFTNENKTGGISIDINEQKRLISAEINGLKIINVYVPNGSSIDSEKYDYKIQWLNYLSAFLDDQVKNDDLVCLVGDFNIAPSEIDIHTPQKYEGGIMASKIEREALNNVLKGRFIDSFRIFEKNTGHWSWWDYRNNAYELNKGWRIDHIYISKNLSSKLKSCVIERNQRENLQPSDHAPVLINLEIDSHYEDYLDVDDDLFEI
ncbi:exodeoxyribonuclease III [Prochlorococcus marinus subsp. pastoris str. CCMP1986]|uniref:Exodeoxyribonuclease III n=1 Tax=Prochlorococcus marinus subsp. pastoris (strain CCMP1986 / NIES-2087 / MED4) TaxID=59919 RepID=Q7V2J2_PROMP|nr:exodeoxyribonuclease III [Prochlorococcus marinus]KGF86165.1 Exodeoxyribonuclease III [Prochlorococcus marinus str. EQPAC1]CAE18943.1 exodeoxyribonuclease III [Prochlorococcus marinus subsp. pastoris str. CCMP1986]